jgi:glucan biosynthesis protein C
MDTSQSLAGTTGPQAGRQPFLDALRVLAFALLVPYHVGMYYVTWDWHVKSPAASTLLEPLMLMTAPWRMGLLFLISGVATAHMLKRSGFVAQRSKRLLLPLLFGMAVVVPPQAYFEVVEKLHYAGSYLDFMGLYAQGFKGFCKGDECLSLPTWNHLWFLPYVWVYGLLAWGLWHLAPAAVAACRARLDRLGLWGVALLALPLMAARQLAGLFPSTHNLHWDWYNHLQYGYLFAIGWLATGDGVWQRMARLRWWALGTALLSWAVLLVYFMHYAEQTPPEALRALMRCVWGGLEWAALVAALGWGRQALNTRMAWVQRLNPMVFCAYVLHQTLIVLLTRALKPQALNPALEGVLLVLLTFALCALGYALARRVPGLRLVMGISPVKAMPGSTPTAPAPPAPAAARPSAAGRTY